MKNIYFVEAGFSFEKDIYLPYATGMIAAFLKEKGCFGDEFNLAGFIYRREQTDSIVRKLDNPYIVGFSCCIWNFEFNLVLARKIKEKFPECTIIFGGHSVTESANLLQRYPFIDILIYGEGERVFYDLLCNVESGALARVGNISFRKSSAVITTAYSAPCDIDTLPSPYLSGIFDNILAVEERSSLLCVLETNRGCPYSCSYCDWCAGKRVRKFPLKRVLAEIRWIAENSLEYCFCADSNFGMFDRDVEIADFVAKMKEKYGFPHVLRTCFAKESNENVFKISKILNDAKMDKGATLAYQTLSPTALENIHRKNLTLEHFSSLLKKYNEAGIPAYSELILGLPGETKESFCKGICDILESGQHNSLSVYYLELLPNSEMAQKSFIQKHKISSVKVEFNHMHSHSANNEVHEFSNIVQSTATLTKNDWVYCNLFSVCVQCFHSLGFFRCIALYLNSVENVSYYRFYSQLLNYILNCENSVAYDIFKDFERKLSSSLSGNWNYTSPELGEIAWSFEEGAYLCLLKEIERVHKEFKPFFDLFFEDEAFFSQLIEYQKAVLRSCDKNNEKHIFDYDFPSFFDKVQNGEKAYPQKETAEYVFRADKDFSSWKDFAKEIVWYGRRRGDTYFSSRPNSKTAIIKFINTGM